MATAKRDYYEVLGVDRQVSPEDLKKAYRKLAMQFHPDRNQGDPGAEQRFKEIGEAYAVLSDPDKRQRYDTYGHAANGMPDMGGFSFDSAFDLFNMFFGGGGGGGRRHSGPQRGSDLRMVIDVAFEEAIFGASRTLEVPRADTCPECTGSGAKAGTTANTCPDCGGAGQVRRMVQSIFGQGVTMTVCQRCRGEGKLIEHPCGRCHGQGLVDTRKTIEVAIPPGVDEDVSVRVTGEGEPGPRGGGSGDLYLSFRIKPHAALVRRGTDLIYELAVTVPQAVLGDSITVPTVTGEHEVVLPAGTQHGRVIKLQGMGAPHVRSGRRGDQICVVRVVIPTSLTAHDRQLYEQLEARDGRPAVVKKGFFDHLKDAFKG